MKDVKKKLEDEIRVLEAELKIELPRAIQKAREHGDLSENAEYHAAKERQRFVQAKVSHLRERLAKLSMVNLKNIPEGKAAYGSTVVVRDTESDKQATYKLVTSEEANAALGLISVNSPVGQSLMGHEEGDEVEVHTPGGKKTYEILRLTTIHQEVQE
ncbi:MAG: transcription elongation factor GreA [Acidobacteria bacterium]|nr:transcription elongation factor GreA [Acidobacteriota bacterium]